MFSNIDEHVRRLPRRPASAALHPGLPQERSMLVSRDGRHLDPGKVGRIDVRRLEWGHSVGNRALFAFALFAFPFAARVRGVRGLARRSDRQPTRLRRSLHTA